MRINKLLRHFEAKFTFKCSVFLLFLYGAVETILQGMYYVLRINVFSLI